MSAEPTTENKELEKLLAPFMAQPFTPPSMSLEIGKMLLGEIVLLAAKVDALTQAWNARGGTAKEPQGERPLKAKELCRLMDVSPSTVRNWRKSPDFPVVEQKGRGKRPIQRYVLSEVRAWHEKQRRIAQEMAK